ncbi:MarR family transcriptional regulator [Bombilactobacillus bombi]|uniref:MarR family winged helix-turn-helix transcriptional regulator n=1 Tax=Bombilactobacillus bombi TaxID=1303590 RepID=UPI000E56925C|nr:MarR family transcriptional regulator [Bombilactobacillus bombi]AXX64116.1 MarR family transcriptional regulator [Bombilactobacillus bombi]
MDQAKLKHINKLLSTVFANVMHAEEQALKNSQFNDITIHEIHAINAITMYQHKTSSQIAAELQITPGTVTTMVNKLVRKGYVVRIHSDDDRRFVRLGLTRKGRLFYRIHDAYHRKMIGKIMDGFTDEQVYLFEKALINAEAFFENPSLDDSSIDDNN